MREVGNWGLTYAATGLFMMTLVFFVSVRWWTDGLGRAIAAALGSCSMVLLTALAVLYEVPLPGGLLFWRILSYWTMGTALWAGVVGIVWAQFFAPRVKQRSPMSNQKKGDLQ